MGTIIGIQLALSFPDKVVGLFLVSPLGTEEVRVRVVLLRVLTLAKPADVADGRRQIHDTWREAFQGKDVDQEAIKCVRHRIVRLG